MRQKVISSSSTFPPTGGMGQAKQAAAREEAFSPVVTRVRQVGIWRSKAGMSVGVTTSRKASEALSRRRLISVAVS